MFDNSGKFREVNAKVTNYKETEFRDNNKDYGIKYSGICIDTDKGLIHIGIDIYQQCCETWGFEIYNANNIIDKTITEIIIDDIETANYIKYKKNGVFDNSYINSSDYIYSVSETDIMVEILFNDGESMFVLLYNNHNGYYAHDILIDAFGYEYHQNI